LITETFLNSCFSLLLNKQSRIKKDRALYRDILDILSFYKEKEKIEIPMGVQNKFECLMKMCEMKLENKTDDSMVDSLTMSQKYRPLSDFLTLKMEEPVREDSFQDHIRHVRLRKKINFLFSNYDELNKVLESVRDGSFESMDDLILDYEGTIKKLFLNMMESNRSFEVEASASLDLMQDDYETVVQGIIDKYERKNTTPTGYQVLDNEVMHGGFEPSRLYLFGGGSGAGKSTILLNFIMNAASQDRSLLLDDIQAGERLKDGEIGNVYIYVTLENTIDESLARSYMILFDKTLLEVLRDIKQFGPEEIKQRVINRIAISNSTVVMKYYRPQGISPYDLMGLVDDVSAQYGQNKIRGLYIDYLDKLRTDMKYDLHRLELGHITSSLKTVAVEFAIPTITVTQLGRSIYEGITDCRQLTLNLVSEAIKKVEDADFVGLQAKDAHDPRKIHMNVRKNRGGECDIGIEWNVNLAMYKFLSGKKISNEKKSAAYDPATFGGLGVGI